MVQLFDSTALCHDKFDIQPTIMPTRRATIETPDGLTLAAIVDSPSSAPTATAVLAHCFTCTKDLKALVKVSRRLAENGIAVVRFDFRGLGLSLIHI